MGLAAALLKVVVVIPLVGPHLSMVDLEDPVDEFPQEVPVMADKNHSAGELFQDCQQNLP